MVRWAMGIVVALGVGCDDGADVDATAATDTRVEVADDAATATAPDDTTTAPPDDTTTTAPDDTTTPPPDDTTTTDAAPEIDSATTSDAGPELVDDVAPDPCPLGASVHDDLYVGVEELQGEALRDALHTLVSDGSQGFGYDAARNLMYGITGSVDVDANNDVECVYTGVRVQADGTRSPGSGDTEITTEHSWPRSDGAESFPAEGDLHHIYPVLAHANGTRGVNEYGETTCGHAGEPACAWSQGGSHLGSAPDGRPVVFEVRPARRGDIARAHFFFAVRYALPIPALEEATLRRWHCEDPPADDERARNDRVEVHQHNRNPFIDQPTLVGAIADF